MNLLRNLLFVIALLPIAAQAGWFGSYDDCILENMKGVQAVNAANAVRLACRSKYPEKKVVTDGYVPTCYPLALTFEETSKIKLQPGALSYTVFNNNDFKIVDLVVELTFNNQRIANKDIGSIKSVSSESMFWTGDTIASFQVIRANKQVCL